MGKRNATVIILLALTVSTALLFQNCSQLNRFASLTSIPSAAQGSKSQNPLAEMMNYSEQQIKDTRQKLEKRSDLFGEERLDALKVGADRVPAADPKSVAQPAAADEIDFEDLEDSKKAIPNDPAEFSK